MTKILLAAITFALALVSNNAAAQDKSWYDLTTGEVHGGQYGNIGQRFMSGPYPCDEYKTVKAGGVSYQTAATQVASEWQSRAADGDYSFVRVSANCDSHQPKQPHDNEDYCANRSDRFGQAIIEAGVPEWAVLRGSNFIDSTPSADDTHFATAWILSANDINLYGTKQFKEEVAKRLYIVMRSEDHSHTWGPAILAMADSLCGGTLVLHETKGWEVIWEENCECADEQEASLSSANLADTLSTWTPGKTTNGVAYDIVLTSERNEYAYTEDDFRGKSLAEQIVMIWGSKIPDWDHPEFGRLKALLVRSHVTIRGTFDPMNPSYVDDRIVMEFPGKCDRLMAQREADASTKQLSKYVGSHFELGAQVTGGAFFGNEENPAGVRFAGITMAEAQLGFSVNRLGDTNGDGINDNVNGFMVLGTIGGGYHPNACQLPGSLIVGGYVGGIFNRDGNVGGEIGGGYRTGLATQAGVGSLFQSAYVKSAINVHRNGDVSGATASFGFEAGPTIVRFDGNGDGSSSPLVVGYGGIFGNVRF